VCVPSIDVFTDNHRVVLHCFSPIVGHYAFVLVGAAKVGSCIVTAVVSPPEAASAAAPAAPTVYNKGDELGYFAYGGSSILVAFEPGRVQFDQDLLDFSEKQQEVVMRMGEHVGVAKA
jgi:phosphatidylserine decarboxylase